MRPWTLPRIVPTMILTALVTGGGWSTTLAASLEITGVAATEVLLDGTTLGFLPLSEPVTVAPGRHEIRCEQPGFVPYKQLIDLATAEDHLLVTIRMTPLSRKTALTSNILLAGLGQHYLGQKTRGWFYNTAEIAGLLAALAGEIQRGSYRQDYLLLRDRYDQTINSDEATTLRLAADKAYSDMEDMESMRNLGLAVAGGAVLVSMHDAWISFPGVTGGAGQTPVATIHQPDSSGPAFHAGVNLGF